MSLADLLLPLLVAASAAISAIFAGRAQASRLRSLHKDISNGNLRGYLTISVVIVVVFASWYF